MNSGVRIVKLGALIFSLICIIQSLFLSFGLLSYLDNFFFIFGLTYLGYVLFSEKKWRGLILAFGLLFIWSVTGQLLRGDSDFFSNLSYCLMFLKWPIIIISISKAVSDYNEVRVRSIISAVFLILVGINLFMAVNPFGLGEIFQNIYSTSLYTDFAYYNEYGSYRLAGTQTNPNDNAAIWAFFIIYYAKNLSRNWYFALLAVGLLLLTQSRTIFLILIGIGLIVLLKLIIKQKSVKVLFFGLFMILLLGVVGLFSSRNLKSIFTGDAFKSNSLLTRFSHFQSMKSSEVQEIIAGQGVINNPVESVGFYLDSEYLALIMQFGLVGLIFWMLIILALFQLGKNHGNQMIYFLLIIIGASTTNFTLLHASLGVVLSVFLGLSLVRFKTNEISAPENKPISA